MILENSVLVHVEDFEGALLPQQEGNQLLSLLVELLHYLQPWILIHFQYH